MVLYVGNVISAQIPLTADYFVISYEFTDGEDLDTRTAIPAEDPDYVGWDQYDELIYLGDSTFGIVWAGDNTGTGFESVLFNRSKFSEVYPATTSVTFDLRAMWYEEVGDNPVVISLTGYSGGTMFIDDFQWKNTTFNVKYDAFSTFSKVVTYQSQDGDDLGERVCLMTLDFANLTVTYTP